MFKKLTEDARLPERATRFSAGFDVFANEDVVIGAGETKLIGLGIAIDKNYLMSLGDIGEFNSCDDFHQAYYLALHIRSSLRAKGLTSLGTGIIDMDFTQEIKMVVHNPFVPALLNGSIIGYEDRDYEIKKGDKIGQLILCRHEGFLLPSEYTKDEERLGGFGSTGA